MRKKCRLCRAEELIAEMDFSEVADDILESEGDYQLILSGWWVNIPELGLNLHEGIFCNYNSEENAFLPDFSITVIKEVGQEEWIYYEQDGFLISLVNFLNGRMAIDTLEQMTCFICLSETD